MQQTVTFFIRVSSARPKYSTHAHVLQERRQDVISIFRRFGRWWRAVSTSWSIRQAIKSTRLSHTWRTPGSSRVCVASEMPPGCWTCPLTYRSNRTWQKRLASFHVLIADWPIRQISQTHGVVVGESGGCFLDGRGSHTLLFYSDSDRVPETGSHQFLQFLRLSGWKQAGPSLLRQVAQDGVQTEHTSTDTECVTNMPNNSVKILELFPHLASKPISRSLSASSRTSTSRLFTKQAKSRPSAFLLNISSRRPGVAITMLALKHETAMKTHKPSSGVLYVIFWKRSVCLNSSFRVLGRLLLMKFIHLMPVHLQQLFIWKHS